MPANPPKRPRWKSNILHSAIAAVCANGLFASQVQAANCGPTVSVSQGQCIFSRTDNSTVTSGVSISTTNTPLSAVLYEYGEGEGVTGSLTNLGSITANSSEGNSTIDGVRINTNLHGSIDNQGTISANNTVSSGTATANGLFLNDSLTGSGQIDNRAGSTITATAVGIESTADAHGLRINDDLNGILNNHGQIYAIANSDGEDTHSEALAIDQLSGFLNNHGYVRATTDSNGQRSYAEAVSVRKFYGTLNNYGTLSAHSDNNATSAGFYGRELDGATLNNFGTIEGTSDDGDSGWSLDIGAGEDSAVNNKQGAVLRGNIFIRSYENNGLNTLNNDGLIDFTSTETDGDIEGNFTQSANGTLRITASGEDSHSSIRVDKGTASINGKAFVNVEEVNTLAVGQTLDNVVYVTGAGQLNGNFYQVNDNSVLFNFVSIANEGEDGHINFEITKGMTARESVITSGNPTGEGGAEVLDEIIEEGTSDPGMQKVIDALGRLSSEQQVSDAVSQTLPLITGNSAIASTSTLSGIRRVVQTRIEAHKGVSYGDSHVAADNELWIKPFGSRVDQDDRDGVSGFEGRTSGLVFGVDGMRSEETRLGISFAYAQANIDGNSTAAPNSAEVDIYQLLGYGTHDLGEGRELSFQAGIGQNKTQGERDILFLNETAKANYSSVSTTLGVGLADTYRLNEVTKFVPSARADYTWVKDESYTETGSSANLQVDSHSTDELILTVDGKLSHELSPSTDVTANLSLGYDALDAPSSITASFAGAPGSSFVTEGLDSSPWLQRAGFGVIKTTDNGMEVSLRYDAEHRESFLNQTASVKFRWDF